MELTDDEKSKIQNVVIDKLQKSFESGKLQRGGQPFFKVICFMLDMYNQRNFYGTLAVNIAGPDVKKVFIQDRTYKLDTLYTESGESVIRLLKKSENS